MEKVEEGEEEGEKEGRSEKEDEAMEGAEGWEREEAAHTHVESV